ncbi:MAG: MBL fold metallo-hydrolase, partial [Bdellovibrionales bacterium]|nr:MBL fold metallo-hydrolase [Bdellovibrionales bacterium]
LREPVDNIEWGHASAQIGIDLAIREGIKKVIFTHFDPAATDARVAEAMEMTSDYYNSLAKNAEREGKRFKKIDWQFAFDGMLLEV